MKLKKRIGVQLLSLLLICCMVLGGLPLAVFAQESQIRANQTAEDAQEQSGETPLIKQSENTATPTLPYDEGLKAYTISSVADLNTLRRDLQNDIDYTGKRVLLTQDIDLAAGSTALEPYAYRGTSSTGRPYYHTFNGLFNGQGHTILNYTDSRSGLFDAIGSSGQVGNLLMTVNMSVNSTQNLNTNSGMSKGVIADYNEGSITRCGTSGVIVMKDKAVTGSIGGISGRSSGESGSIDNCYSLIEFNNDVKAKASFYGISSSYVGSKCFYAGKMPSTYNSVQPISNSFNGNGQDTCVYDVRKLGITIRNAYGVGFTSAKMKDQSEFEKLGWDFGTSWKMGEDHPELNFEKDTSLKLIQRIDVSVKLAPKTYDAEQDKKENRQTTVVSVTPVLDENPYNLKCEYKVKDSTTPQYIGMMGENARGYACFEYINLIYDENEVCEYELTSSLQNRIDASGNQAQVTAYGDYFENGVKLTSEEKQAVIDKAKEACDITLTRVLMDRFGTTELTKADAADCASNSWFLFTAARCGYPQPYEGFYDDCFQAYVDMYAAHKGNIRSSEMSKDILAITAMGYDARNVGGYDLIEMNMTAGEKGLLFVNETMQLAYSSHNYEIPASWDETAFIHELAEPKTVDAEGKPLTGDTAGDMWTMTLQPMVMHYDANAKEGDEFYDVKVATEDALKTVSRAQTDMGACNGGYDENNPWTNAQVEILMGLIPGIDPLDNAFIKNGNTILDGTFRYFDFENKTANGFFTYEPQQIARGLNAVVRASEGKNNLFDCTDVPNHMVDFNNELKTLPEMSALTEADREPVMAAYQKYETLTEGQKNNILPENLNKLTQDYNYFTADEQLTKAIQNAETEIAKTEVYTSDSINTVKTALDTAKGFTGNSDKAAVVRAADALNNAVKAMITVEADVMSDVEKAITAIGDINTLQDKDRVDAAQKKYDALKLQESKERVANADVLFTAQKAIAGLQRTGETLKTELAAAEDKLKQTDTYTKSSLDEAKTTVDAAKKIDVSKASMTDMNKALNDLSNVYWEYIGDKGDLNTKIQDVETAIKVMNKTEYTEESWTTLEKALKTAKEAVKDDDVNQDAIDEILENLNIAFANLELNRALGDVNNDGEIDELDASLILRNSAKLEDFDDVQKVVGDVNKDEIIDELDASLVLRYSAKLIDSFEQYQ